MPAAVQIKEGKWFARDGKTKRKSSQYFEVRAPFLLCPSRARALPNTFALATSKVVIWVYEFLSLLVQAL